MVIKLGHPNIIEPFYFLDIYKKGALSILWLRNLSKILVLPCYTKGEVDQWT